ncbi:hypothetical protein E2C01_035300 [Portunus trituberculatus]|uniref:Uncharacterized protein n=1 Tax=Portunus trituberculatus TaxID=210409 RepID=A0A5B7F2V7_PORTR|nr:hypothetical protein [Portunus trituberculatus]
MPLPYMCIQNRIQRGPSGSVKGKQHKGTDVYTIWPSFHSPLVMSLASQSTTSSLPSYPCITSSTGMPTLMFSAMGCNRTRILSGLKPAMEYLQ